MTETQNTKDHRAPLARGEIRTHTVGNYTFTVMHVAGGSFAQAGLRYLNKPTTVLATTRFEDVAVRAYADAIEEAESDAIDALDDADGSSYTASGAYIDSGAAYDIDRLHAEAFGLPVTVAGESSMPLAELLDAYGEAMAKAVMYLTYDSGRDTATLWAGNADKLKAEILARFGS